MTEKRFLVICDGFGEDSDVLIREDIDEWRYDLTPIYEKGAYNKAEIDKIINRLNELYEENEQLKSDNNRLVNETAKIVAEHQRKVLDLIDEKIDELEERYKFGQEVYQGCPMHNIRFGINTLKELKKELEE